MIVRFFPRLPTNLKILPVAALFFAAAAVLLPVTGSPVRAQEPLPPTERCLVCHVNPDLTFRFADRTVHSGRVNAPAFRRSVHGQEDVTCTDCHPDHTDYPHPRLAEKTPRDYTLARSAACVECHTEQADHLRDSSHARALSAGNPGAPVCVDCHGSHNTVALKQSRQQVPQTCRRCHATIFDEYRASIHGAALAEEGNPDAPTCTDCHGMHQMADPNAAAFHLQSPRLCADCHADSEMMARYNISTAVFDTYVADFHGATVTLFEQQSPGMPTNKAVCTDCHGVHNIRAMDDPAALAGSKENLLNTCRRCHPDASANFPDSWTSHFPPTFSRQPLVASVNLFYLIAIPATIGLMGLFVVTDAGRRVLDRGKSGRGVRDE